MNKIAALFIFVSLITLSGCELTKYSDKPTNEPRAVIIEQAPYYQGESIHDINPEIKANKCIRTDCGYTECNTYELDSEYCEFEPKKDCNQLIDCDGEGKTCSWKRSPEYNQCIEKIEEEISETNRKLDEGLEQCNISEPCTIEYQFRDDHFQFVLPPYKKIGFSGDAIRISSLMPDGQDNGLDITIYIYEGVETGMFDEIEARWNFGYKRKKELVGDVPVITYYNSDAVYHPGEPPQECTNYAVVYNGKTYNFYGYEGCYGKMSREIIETIKFMK